MRIFRDARRLVTAAYSTRDPQGFVQRWLAQDFNKFDAAIAILALEEISGQRWNHPETPTPTIQQILSRPTVWSDALRMIESCESATVLESQASETSTTWSAVNGTVRRAYDIERKGSRPIVARQKSKNEKPYAYWR